MVKQVVFKMDMCQLLWSIEDLDTIFQTHSQIPNETMVYYVSA